MLGCVHIYVNKKDRKISLLKAYITKIGYGQAMGYLIPTKREGLKSDVLTCIEDKKIFLELKRRGEKSKTWSLEAAKDSQRRDIIKDLDEISESIEESLKKQESLY